MKNLKSWVLTFIIWALLFWWESSSGARTSTILIFQFILAWIYLISATIYVEPYNNVEIHNKLIGGKLFDLNSGFYLFPLVMWWGAIYKSKESNLQTPNTPHIYLDTRDLKEAVDNFTYKNVKRERQLTGFWGAFEDFTRQYFGNLNLKDSWWIFIVTGLLAILFANYSIWFTKKFYPENFDKVYEAKVINSNNSNNYQNQVYNLNDSSKSSASVTSNSNLDQDNFEEKEDINAVDREKIDNDLNLNKENYKNKQTNLNNQNNYSDNTNTEMISHFKYRIVKDANGKKSMERLVWKTERNNTENTTDTIVIKLDKFGKALK